MAETYTTGQLHECVILICRAEAIPIFLSYLNLAIQIRFKLKSPNVYHNWKIWIIREVLVVVVVVVVGAVVVEWRHLANGLFCITTRLIVVIQRWLNLDYSATIVRCPRNPFCQVRKPSGKRQMASVDLEIRRVNKKIYQKYVLAWKIVAIPGAVRYEQTTDIEESGCLIKHLRALSTR